MRTAVADTSINAFHQHRACGALHTQENLILGFISTQGGDWSIGELALRLSMQKSTVSARINDLLKFGILEPAPKRKDAISGITVRPVRLPPAQRELFAA